MAPKLFANTSSPSVRAVLLTSKALGVNLELDEVDFNNKDQFKPAFLKINPQHTVPTLVDDDEFIVWDSHAISGYLVDKYGGIDDSLYPADMQLRATVNQRLHFDTELQCLCRKIVTAILYEGKKSVPQEIIDEILTRYDFLEKFLQKSTWVAGDTLTCADFSLIATITTLDILVPVDAKKFPKIAAWLKKAYALPYYGANKNGLDKLRGFLQQALEG